MYLDLDGGSGLTAIKTWCQMILRYGSIQLASPLGNQRITRTKENIEKAKNCLRQKTRISVRGA